MRAIVYHGIGDIRLEKVAQPQIQDEYDAIVRITGSAICGTDLHLIRGTIPGMRPGTILGHEGVGIIEEVAPNVRNFERGDRVVIASTIGCGFCSYCRSGYFSQCDHANPNGTATAFFGSPVEMGAFNGMQAEYARVPYANIGMIRIPEPVTDNQAILLSDIFPTGYFAASLAEIRPGNTVAVFGCGPVGQFSILSAYLMGAGRVFAIDRIPSRLQKARELNAEIINFDEEYPIEAIKAMTGGIGVERVIDAVGVDAQQPFGGPSAQKAEANKEKFKKEVNRIAPSTNVQGGNWIPGNAPSQVLRWAIEVLAKAGTLSIVGVYPPAAEFFPIGMAMNKNLTVNMGNCNHRRYLPRLMNLVESGAVDPERIITQTEPLVSAIEAYRSFDKREEGWLKVELFTDIVKSHLPSAS